MQQDHATLPGSFINDEPDRLAPGIIVMFEWAQDERLSLGALGLIVRLKAHTAASGGSADFHIAEDDVEHLTELLAAGYLIDTGVEYELANPFARPAVEVPRRRKPAEIDPDSVVYYLRRSDGLVKIGFSKTLGSRIETLTKLFGDLKLLAVEPGSRAQELRRHAQFDAFRASGLQPSEGTEWFRPEPALMAHINTLAGAR
jgi:hypothetical protein